MHPFWEIRQGAPRWLKNQLTPAENSPRNSPCQNFSQNRASWQKQKICIVMSWMASSNFMVFQLQWKRGGSAGLWAHPKDEQLMTTEVRKICWLCHAGTNWLRCCSNKGFLADLSLPATDLVPGRKCQAFHFNTPQWNWLSRIEHSECATLTWGSLQRAPYYSGPSVRIERILLLTIQRLAKKQPEYDYM